MFSELFELRPDDRYHCIQCGKNYKHKSHVVRHLRYECCKEKEFECYICLQRFHQECNMKTHLSLKHHVVLQQNKKAIILPKLL